MNFKALVTGLFVLGSTSLAMAAPAKAPAQVTWSAGASISASATASVHVGATSAAAPRGTAMIRDHRGDYRGPGWETTNGHPPFVPVWTTLGTMSKIFDGDMTFAVRPMASRFTTLKLQSLAGKSLVYRVKIQFANGRTQTVELNQYLMANHPAITIDLAGESARSVTKITVVGRNARASSYSVLAM